MKTRASLLSSLSLRSKLLLITLSVLVLGGTAGAWMMIDSYRRSMLDTARASNDALCATIAEYGAAPLIFEDSDGAAVILGKLASNGEVLRARLFDPRGKVFAHYERNPASKRGGVTLVAERAVVHEGQPVGRLVIETATTVVQRRIAEMTRSIVAGSVVLVLLCALLALRLQQTLTGPLARLATAIQRVGADDGFDQRVQYAGNDEIGVLYRRFNDMLDQLKQRSLERDRNQLWLRTLVRSLPDQVFVCDAEGRFREVHGDTSHPPEHSGRQSIHEWMPPRVAEAMLEVVTRTLAEEEPVRLEYRLEDGDRHFEAVLARLERTEAAEGWQVLGVSRDVTERVRLQTQFLRAQKLDAVGQLAGGVAHDFNNLLAGIVGYAELIKMGDDAPAAADQILEISSRAADLVRQLLTFSRKETSQKRATDVRDLLRRVEGILQHTLDPRVELSARYPEGTCTVQGDPSQLESAVLNLALNARDAMPQGGTLTITSQVVALDELALSTLDSQLPPGNFVEITVADTGTGIAPENLSRIFEPFFTTKEAGKGTGLGLAAVYGTVHGHGGGIRVRSEPGKGTAFHLYLPSLDVAAEKTTSSKPVHGTGRLLLIDDEEAVLKTAKALLTQLGYEVEAFSRPRDGIAYFEDAHARIDGVVVDMIMPQMSGLEVIERMRQIDPRVPILMASGYLGMPQNEPLEAMKVAILHKPFTLDQLAREVRELLRRGRVSREQPIAH